MRVLAVTVAAVAMTSVVHAQSAAMKDDRGYVEGVAQASFGNVTSQSFGAELGFRITPTLELFVEGGHVRDAAAPSVGDGAQQIATYLTTVQSGAVSFGVKQPVTFGDAGVRYLFQTSSRLTPYVLGAAGVARVNNNVTFSINGTDVTSTLANYFVVLGGDLAGSSTKAMMVIGGGVQWPAWQQLVVDVQYRYGRIFADPGTNLNRAGVGIGLRF